MEIRDPKSELLDWIKFHFPQIAERIPRKPLFIDFGNLRMLSSHNLPNLYDFLNSSGYISFLKSPDVPDGFFSCGIKSPAVSESFLVMWKESTRLFWFNDQYALYIIKSDDSIENTQSHLDEAMQLWNSGKQYVFSLLGKFFEHDEELIQKTIEKLRRNLGSK